MKSDVGLRVLKGQEACSNCTTSCKNNEHRRIKWLLCHVLGSWRSMSTWQKLNDGDISDRHTTDAHNMLNGNRRRASYFFTCFLQLLQQPIDAWRFLQHLLYQSTVVKNTNAPGLTWTYYYTNILHLCRSYPCPGCVASEVDRYGCFFNSSIFCARFGSTWCSFRSLRNLSMHLGLGLIGFFLPTFIVDISLDTLF